MIPFTVGGGGNEKVNGEEVVYCLPK
jgi:hypothetical protein